MGAVVDRVGVDHALVADLERTVAQRERAVHVVVGADVAAERERVGGDDIVDSGGVAGERIATVDERDVIDAAEIQRLDTAAGVDAGAGVAEDRDIAGPDGIDAGRRGSDAGGQLVTWHHGQVDWRYEARVREARLV